MNLEQLRKHPSFPFIHFEENDLEFLLLEMFWIELFRSCFNNPEELAHWKSLYPAERDASPVLVMANDITNRAIHVQLRVNEDNSPIYTAQASAEANCFLPFDLWLDELFESTGEKRYSGLVISTDMSAQALSFAEKAMTRFCRDLFSAEKTQEMIDQYYSILEERGFYWH